MNFDKVLQTKNKTKGTNTIDYILLHHTGGGTYEGNIRTLTVGDVSCHYVVGPDGKVAKIGEDEDILWHAGESKWKGLNGMNSYSIGIEIVNKERTFTDQQRVSVRELVVYLMKTHNIPSSNIIRHKDIAPERKVDVYDEFRNNQYKTFADYQKSYDRKYTTEEKNFISETLKHNSQMYGFTQDSSLKELLNQTNTKIREIYKGQYSI